MECEVTSTYSNGIRRSTTGNVTSNGTNSPITAATRTSSSSSGSAKSQLHVEFTENGEVKEKREKYLTAKYGSHQMSLIRKRLAVEMWLYDELQKLFENEVTNEHNSKFPTKLDDDRMQRGLHKLNLRGVTLGDLPCTYQPFEFPHFASPQAHLLLRKL